MKHAKAWVLCGWLLALLLCVRVIVQTTFVADLSAFMPKMPTARQQLLVEQLRDGFITRLIMVGIEGSDAPQRARLSQQLAQSLRKDQAFLGVQNGDAATQERDQAYVFGNRYVLSPAVTPERFTAEGLRQAIGETVSALSGNAGMALKQLLPRDPTAETLAILEQFSGDSQPRSRDGAWVSRDGQRAILLVQTRADGSDLDAQSAAIEHIRHAFDGIADRPAAARLVMSGAGVFSVASRARIEHEVMRLGLAGTALVIALLLPVYRSVGLLLLGLLPVLSGALVGVTAVSLGFGQVHGLTLGFGTTLIGEAVDYSIYTFIQHGGGHGSSGFWRTIRLGVMTSVAGFAALLFSGFPGLSQLGLYSISGLVAAVLVTRFVLPLLMPAQPKLRDLARVGQVLEQGFRRLGGKLWLLLLVLAGAAAVVAWHHDTIWNRQLSALSPVTKQEQVLDASLRSDLGALDMRYIASFTAPDEQAALRGAEQAGVALRRLVAAGELGGFNSPAYALPSVDTQRRRQAALPEEQELRSALDKALAGMPIHADKLAGFVTDVAAAKQRQPLARSDLDGSSMALLVDSLLVHRSHDILVFLPLRAPGHGPHPDTIDVSAVSAALAAPGLPGITVIDLMQETTDIFDRYLGDAVLMSGVGALAIVGLLLVSLRSVRRTALVTLPLAAAVVCVTAGLLLTHHQLTILHLVGLLLVVAVGSNYALFFDGGLSRASTEERLRMQTSVVLANLATVGSFGLLGLSSVPVLSAIGGTVAAGAFLALLFSAML
jgi:predicted exporter